MYGGHRSKFVGSMPYVLVSHPRPPAPSARYKQAASEVTKVKGSLGFNGLLHIGAGPKDFQWCLDPTEVPAPSDYLDLTNCPDATRRRKFRLSSLRRCGGLWRSVQATRQIVTVPAGVLCLSYICSSLFLSLIQEGATPGRCGLSETQSDKS